MVNTLDAWENKIPDVQKMLKTLQQKKVYPIARLVVFKDPYLAEKRPEFALKQPNGEVWRDYKGMAWVIPSRPGSMEYNIQIAKEAVKMGFSEIQFDYVRFASDGDLRSCVYPYADGSSKEDVIRDFLLYAREELEPLGAVVSADVFGLACSAPDDLFIGQKLEKIAEAVPVICPMVYPSHYARGSYGLANPDLQPYATVLRSLQDAGQRLKDYPVKLRPWLQDFLWEMPMALPKSKHRFRRFMMPECGSGSFGIPVAGIMWTNMWRERTRNPMWPMLCPVGKGRSLQWRMEHRRQPTRD